jgi:predicted HNH restriction endonuclease
VPNCNHPTFLDEDGIPYTEVHHIEPLSEGGPDVLENVACLCPAHHREVHLGRRASELTAALRAIRNEQS